jgi:hypothetical protein
MKNDGIAMLSRINGITEALYWIPTSGKVSGEQLNRVGAWQFAHEHRGLSFGQSADDAPVLRELVGLGLLECSGGRTKATAHRLTWRGLLASMPPDGVTAQELLADLELIASMADRSTITLPGTDHRVLMGHELCPAAGSWFCDYTRDFKTYSDELARWEASLLPLAAMGWIHRLTDCLGRMWAVDLTAGGRKAIADPPDVTITTGTAFGIEEWEAGWRWGLTRFVNATPPPWTDSTVLCMLPASRWV